MKKLIFALLLLWPTISNCRIVEPSFMEGQFEEFSPYPVSGIYHFCKAKVIENTKLMKNEKKTQIYLIYRAKIDAYLEMLEYIKEDVSDKHKSNQRNLLNFYLEPRFEYDGHLWRINLMQHHPECVCNWNLPD